MPESVLIYRWDVNVKRRCVMKFVSKSFTLTEKQVKIIDEKAESLGVTPSETMRRILDRVFKLDTDLVEDDGTADKTNHSGSKN